MIQEEKSLLLRELCARLPYNIKVDITYSKEHGSSYRLRICSEGCLILNTDVLGLYIEDEIYLKPYLRPMSSMTKEEERDWWTYKQVGETWEAQDSLSVDWLNKFHFDYRGLIEKGVAIEAPEDMYK